MQTASLPGSSYGEAALAAVGASHPITMIFMAVCRWQQYRLCRCGFPPVRAKKYSALTNGYLHHLLRLHCGQRGSDACRHFRRKCHASPHPHPCRCFRRCQTLSAYLYLWVFVSCIFIIYCNGIITSLGDSRTPLYFLIGSS